MSSTYTFIANQASQHSIALLCRVLRVSRSGYYAWRRRAESRRHQAHRQLVVQIRQVYASSRGTYGSPRVHAELVAQGVLCSQKRVARVMRLAGIYARRPRRRRVTTDLRHGLPIAENVLQRDFEAPTANRKWAADSTYIPTRDGWLYLAVVMDVFSRRIIGWSMQPTLERNLVLDALEVVVQRRQPTEQLIHHSDRGSQYASGDYQARLATIGIQCSMVRRGDCFDNAPVESFFGTLKVELVYQHTFATLTEAHQAIFEYIEVFYNQQRRHSALRYLSPMAFEAQQRARRIMGQVA